MDVNYIQLIDHVVKFNYVLTGFLPAGSAHSDGGGLKSAAVMMDLSVSPCSPVSFCFG